MSDLKTYLSLTRYLSPTSSVCYKRGPPGRFQGRARQRRIRERDTPQLRRRSKFSGSKYSGP